MGCLVTVDQSVQTDLGESILFKNVLALTLILGVIVSGAARAGPDEVTRKLMNASPSLFDFGMLRLQLRLNDLTGGKYWPNEFYSPTVSYDWDQDEVRIIITSFNKFDDKENAMSGCKDVFSKVRDLAFIDPKTGKLFSISPDPYSQYAAVFQHIDYQNRIESDDLKDFDKKFKLVCDVRKPGQALLVGHAPLLSSKIYFEM
jgi:hypothetical protein